VPDEVNSDLVRKVVEHHYFKTLVEQEVQARTSAQVRAAWRRFAAPILLAISIAGWFGYDLVKQMQQVASQASVVREKVKQAETLLSAAEALKTANQDLLANLRTQVGSSAKLADRSQGFLEKQLSQLATSQDDLASAVEKRQKELEAQAKKIGEAAASVSGKVAQSLEQIKNAEQDVAQKAKEVTKDQETISSLRDEVKEQQEILNKRLGIEQQFDEINAELLTSRQVEYVLLRSRDSRTVTLHYFEAPKTRDRAAPPPKRYDIRFITAGIKDRFDLKVELVSGADKPREGKGQPVRKSTWERVRDERGKKYPIEGTPFEFTVEFIYHARLAYDFVVLKITPKPTSDAPEAAR